MSQIYLIGMGSNIDPERHLSSAAVAIRKMFPDACFSTVFSSPAVGMGKAADFLNACCRLHSTESTEVLEAWLKQLEDEHERDRSHGSWRPRTLDLDLLMVGEDVLDDELFRYAHAYVPAKELVHLPNVELDISRMQATSLLL